MARAKTSKPATTKTTRKPETASIRPIKEALTKAALINQLAEQNDIPRKPPRQSMPHWKPCSWVRCIRAV